MRRQPKLYYSYPHGGKVFVFRGENDTRGRSYFSGSDIVKGRGCFTWQVFEMKILRCTKITKPEAEKIVGYSLP